MASGSPFDIATSMYYTGIDPFTKKPAAAAKGMRGRRMQRALMQFFKPENWFTVREALIEAGRADLIGGCDGLIPAQPPKEAIEARRRQADEIAAGGHDHTVTNPATGEPRRDRGYLPVGPDPCPGRRVDFGIRSPTPVREPGPATCR